MSIPKEMLYIVYDIYHSTTDYEERRQIYMTKYPEFVEKYSTIFNMLCKPRFNFDKFIQITFDLNKPQLKRTRCSDEALYSEHKKRKRVDVNNENDDNDEYEIKDKDRTLIEEDLVSKLNALFSEQNNALEYLA